MASIRVFPASEVSPEIWGELQDVFRQGIELSLPNKSPEELDNLAGIGDSDRFVASHLDPNTEVGKRFIDNQEYDKARVSVLYDHESNEESNVAQERPVGFAYLARNVSGKSKFERAIKRIIPTTSYWWIREIALMPDKQDKGLAELLGQSVLRDVGFIGRLRKVSTYIWPSEQPFVQEKLEELGFEPTGDDEVDIFGNGEEVTQRRMEARSVRSVLKALQEQTDSNK